MFTLFGALGGIIGDPDPVKLISDRASCYIKKSYLKQESVYTIFIRKSS